MPPPQRSCVAPSPPESSAPRAQTTRPIPPPSHPAPAGTSPVCAANRSLITQLETLRKAALTVSKSSADANAAAARDSLARAERSATIAEEIASAMDERLVEARRAAEQGQARAADLSHSLLAFLHCFLVLVLAFRVSPGCLVCAAR